MIDPITGAGTGPLASTTGIGGAAAPAAAGGLSGNQVLGKDEFLKLLVAQLQNQDPMSPMDGQEMAVQLAQFSSVEQLMQMNEKFDAQTASIGGMTGLLSSNLGSGLIGQEVLARGDVFQVPVDGSFDFELEGQANVTLRVFDAKGAEVAYQPLGPMGPGRHSVDAQALGPTLADGDYTFRIEAVDDQFNTVKADELMWFVVDGITFGENGMRITGGGSSVVLGDVLQVRNAAQQTGNSP